MSGDIVAGGFTLGGVALGFVAGAFTDAWKAKRDARRKWDVDLRNVAAKFIDAMRQVEEALRGKDAAKNYRPALVSAQLLAREMQLISSDRIYRAARKWLDPLTYDPRNPERLAGTAAVRAVEAFSDSSPGPWESPAERDFVREIRREFGINESDAVGRSGR